MIEGPNEMELKKKQINLSLKSETSMPMYVFRGGSKALGQTDDAAFEIQERGFYKRAFCGPYTF